MQELSAAFAHKKPVSGSSGRRSDLSKNLVEFRRRSGERKSNHFLRRHVRRRKYFSACKRARRPPETDERYAVAVAAPILSEGDVLGCVLFVAAHGDGPAGETERKLAQAVSGFLGKQMES